MITNKFKILIFLILYAPGFGYGKSLYEDLYENAAIAVSEEDYQKVFKIWFIHQSIKHQTVKRPKLPMLRSATWLAIDALDICPDNMMADTDGEGVWPIVLHNHVVRHFERKSREKSVPDHTRSTFSRNKQKRPIHFSSLLSPKEIENIKLIGLPCGSLGSILKKYDFSDVDFKKEEGKDDPSSVILKSLLKKAQSMPSLSSRIKEYLAYRLLIIRIYEAEQAARMSSIPEIYRNDFLGLIDMPFERWQSIPIEDRRAMLSILNRMDEGKGQYNHIFDRLLSYEAQTDEHALVNEIIGFRSQGKMDLEYLSSPAAKPILLLGQTNQFKDIASIAGPLAVRAYHQNKIERSLELLALAIGNSQDSVHYSKYNRYALDWIKFILLQHQFDARLLRLCQQYLPKGAYKKLLSSLLWSAAFHGESHIFRHKSVTDALSSRTKKLITFIKPMALRQTRTFMKGLKNEFHHRPRKALRQLQSLLTHLEEESAQVIQSHAELLSVIRNELEQLANTQTRYKRKTVPLLTTIDGLIAPYKAENTGASDRRLKKRSSINLGAMRLEPGHIWPWPFEVPDVPSTDIMRPVNLTMGFSKAKQDFEFKISYGTL